MKALEVKGVEVNFGGVQAIGGLNLSLEPGERRVVIGPNGAGKTTLFNVISGVIRANSGNVFLMGKDVTALPAHRRTALGLSRTFQITNLFMNLSVRENVLISLQALEPLKYVFYRKAMAARGLVSRANALLEEWGMYGRADDPVRSLSHGEHRQLEIILVLAQNPSVILLDEPTQGLSAGETALVIPMLDRIGRDKAILFIEHDMDVAFQIADTVSVLYFGRLLAEGDEGSIRANKQVAEVYLGQHWGAQDQF